MMTVLLVLTFLLLASHRVKAASQNPRHVLLIYGDQKDLPMNLIVDSRLRSIIRAKLNDGVELFSEYFDLPRFPDKRSRRRQLEFLHDKFSGHGLDLIVVVDSGALDQILLHRDWFFPATPVVFCCVTESEYKARRIGPGIKGIPAKLNYGPTLELASQYGVHPTLIHAWKKQLVAGADQVFSNGSQAATADAEAQKAELFEQIGAKDGTFLV
jgi:hypothetical protein